MKRISALVLTLMAVSLLAFTGCKKSSPSDYVNKVYTAMKDKDFKTVVEMMPGMDTASQTDIDGAVEMMKLFDGFSGGITDFKILSEDISDDGKHATVRVQVTYGTGEVEEEVDELEKTSKGWRPVAPQADAIDEVLEEFDPDEYLDGLDYDEADTDDELEDAE